jgi:hypothetical protein
MGVPFLMVALLVPQMMNMKHQGNDKDIGKPKDSERNLTMSNPDSVVQSWSPSPSAAARPSTNSTALFGTAMTRLQARWARNGGVTGKGDILPFPTPKRPERIWLPPSLLSKAYWGYSGLKRLERKVNADVHVWPSEKCVKLPTPLYHVLSRCGHSDSLPSL